ncbi:MAG TPA: BamA/TamA family outer membrane protein, partial [Bacteroidia bacterium]|nr:BamA/TamA family outer membrane protein [Bacteroidia bacterium]
TLGPGGYNDSTDTNAADKIGDSKFEANLEYRFNIIRAINAALFIDAGNIWLRKEVDIYPNGKFRGDKFIGQIAIGAGMGIRVDFSFFIIRVDGAFKLKDPSLPEYDRWTFGKQPLNDIVLNVGIGYPF